MVVKQRAATMTSQVIGPAPSRRDDEGTGGRSNEWGSRRRKPERSGAISA
jgi:hypothetical protein